MRTRATRRGLHLTELGLGAAQFGNLYRETTDEQAASAVTAAWDAGIRYFDTAPHYGLGLSERRLGALLRQYPRGEYVVSSKVGRLLVPSPETAHRVDDAGFAVPATLRREWDFSRDGILRSVESSLERTGLDHLDILYLHDPDDHLEQALGEGIQTLIELARPGGRSRGRRGHEPVRGARRAHSRRRRRPGHARRPLHIARAGSGDRPAAARGRARSRGRDCRRLQLRAAGLAPPRRRRQVRLRAGARRRHRAGQRNSRRLRTPRRHPARGRSRVSPAASRRRVGRGRSARRARR